MNNRRGFTVLELVIVIGVILVLMSLALTVTSVVLAANDRRSVQSTFVLLDQAITSWESQAGRELTYGRFKIPEDTTADEDYILNGNNPSVFFDIYELTIDVTPPITFEFAKPLLIPPIPDKPYLICILLERLLASSDATEIISRLPSSAIRFVPLTTAGVLAGEPLPPWGPNQMPLLAQVREIFDPWNRRIRVIFPGRAATKAEIAAGIANPTTNGIDVEDGSVRTLDEYAMGVCRNRKLCFVSAGPDGDFGTSADNIYSYEPLPRPAQ